MMDDKVKVSFNEWMDSAMKYEEINMFDMAYKRYIIAYDMANRCEDESAKFALEGINRCKKKLEEECLR